LERAGTARRERDTEQAAVQTLAGELEALREKLRALAFDTEQLQQVVAARDQAIRHHEAARQAAETTRLEAERAKGAAEAQAQRVREAEAPHGRLAGLEDDARHLSRAADLVADFRNRLVGTVGPRLSVQAADLFAELTDHEYDRLEVDPETYEIKIHDAGVAYGMGRFSGSEEDLANLALRVAVSEHVRFQSGGQVGLLVLDEVFGPLDGDRKDRMLAALQRLQGRFRQVLVVTHDAEVKEQLPHAIAVVPRRRRRAGAEVVTG
jgi:DNA sulfur modification protein DndD